MFHPRPLVPLPPDLGPPELPKVMLLPDGFARRCARTCLSLPAAAMCGWVCVCVCACVCVCVCVCLCVCVCMH